VLTKGRFPADYLRDQDILPAIETYFKLNQLKQLYRQGWLRRGIPPESCESVAEHAFGVALLCMLLADRSSADLDPLKVLRLALLHDVGEVYAGDLTPSDGVSAGEKHHLEEQSVVQVMAGLEGGENWVALWQEYERGSCAEARFVRQVDRLEMALQAGVYEFQHRCDLSEFLASAEQAISDPALREILSAMRDARRP